MNPARTVLLVDDDEVFRERLARALAERSFEVRRAGDASAALEEARHESPELAVVDLRMPGTSGLELVKELLEVDPATRVVVLTGYGSVATAVEAMRLGAVNYLQKPITVAELLRAFDALPDAPSSTVDDMGTPSLARAEWEYIHRVLADCGGNVSEAARRLRLHRRSLQRKLQKYPPNE